MPAVIKSQNVVASGGGGSSALGSEHLEDDPSASGDKGVFVLAARNDTFATLTSTDGDYSAISVDAKGRLALAPAGALAASGASTLIKNEDAASASGDGGVMMLAVRRDTAGTQVSTDGDYAEIQTDASGRVRVVSDTTGTLTPSSDVSVDGTVGGVTILAANTARKAVLIKNVGAAACRIGTAGTVPTASKGHQLAAGESLFLTLPFITTEALKAIRETSTSTTVTVSEIA